MIAVVNCFRCLPQKSTCLLLNISVVTLSKKNLGCNIFTILHSLCVWSHAIHWGGDRLELSHASPIENISHVVALRDVGLGIREEPNRSDWFLGSPRSSVPKK